MINWESYNSTGNKWWRGLTARKQSFKIALGTKSEGFVFQLLIFWGQTVKLHGCMFFFGFPDDWRLGRSENWEGLEFVQRIGWQVGDVLIFLLLCWLYNKFAWFCWQISMKYCHCDRLHVFCWSSWITMHERAYVQSCAPKKASSSVSIFRYTIENDFVFWRPERDGTLPPYLAIISYTILSGPWNLM